VSYDLVVRGGYIVDGSGRPGAHGDVAVADGRIAAVGEVDGRSREEIDAEGLVVAPGFVDGHTHMDAQVFWDQLGTSSCWHGATSVVMGNCGFTLAPAEPDNRHLVVRNLERAEDIAAEALAAGITWSWSTFAEYLDAVDRVPKGLNYAACVGHSALRTFVMGERAFAGHATADDLAAMVTELTSALRAGAVGFTTSRSPAHATSDDRPVASRAASWDEVVALVEVLGRESDGVFELAQEHAIGNPEAQADWEGRLERLSIEAGVRITFGMFAGLEMQMGIGSLDGAVARGADLYALTHCRGVQSAQSFLTKLGFDQVAEWQEVRSRPIEEQKVLLRDPDVRRRLIHAAHHGDYGSTRSLEASRPKFETMTILESPYLPNATVADEARRRGVDPVEAMIDVALEHELDVFFVQILAPQPEDELVALMRHPRTAMCFSDSGAHVSQIFDSSIYTHLLAYWVRERQALSLEEAVQMITAQPAALWRLHDRGQLVPGYAADITIFDAARVAPSMPRVRNDLPGGARRIEQRAEGIAATIVNGDVFTRDGEATDVRAGHLLRSRSST
jgi:N-acyl-D-amino-acid deacylase